ncbi:integral membrane protein [Bordetella pertussis]|nr:integral membrane protein [Bordetella pertussis]
MLRLVPALAALAAVLLAADRHIDWIALQPWPGLRALWLGGVLLACMLAYFGLLLAAGMRPRDFTRRGARWRM